MRTSTTRKMDAAMGLTVLLSTAFIFVTIGCGNDDFEDTDTSTDTDTESATEPPEFNGVCESGLSDIDTVLSSLEGLDLLAFVDAAYGAYLARSPETAVLFGLHDEYGIDVTLDNLSIEYEMQTYDLVDGIIAIAEAYDEESLSYAERIEWESFTWYLRDIAVRRSFADRPIPFEWEVEFRISPAPILEHILTNRFDITDASSAEAYIDILEGVDDQFACFMENLEDAKDKGLLPYWQTTNGLDDFHMYLAMPGRATDTPFYQTLDESLDDTSLSAAEKEDLLTRAADAIETSVIPAHYYLKETVETLLPDAHYENFQWQFSDGDIYYDYLLSHYLGADITADEAHEHGLAEVDRIRAEMDAIFESLGYPSDETLIELYDRVAEDGGFIPQKDVLAEFENIVEDAVERLPDAFDIMPTIDVTVVDTGYFAYSFDEDGGEYYVNAGVDAPVYAMRTVSYHEAYPGHHMQLSLAFENNMPIHRPYWLYGFFEGWALYSEQLAKDLNWYDGDQYGDLGRLQDAMLRALRVVADTALHSEGWSIKETEEYFQTNIGYSDDDSFGTTAQSEVNRSLRSPGTVPGYNLGMNRFMTYRQGAMDTLGDAFDYKPFHRAILVAGDVPMNGLEFVVDHYVESGGKAAPTVQRSPYSPAKARYIEQVRQIVER